MRRLQELQDLLDPVVSAMGYELVGVEFHSRPKSALLRVYIDNANGITLDDCQAVSHQVSGILDVENVLAGNYELEISSPGLDRPLFKPEHYQRFVGSKVAIRLLAPDNGRRKFTGKLQGLQQDRVVIHTDDSGEVSFLLSNIDQARLVPEF